jgi:hypothetical protein
MPVATICRKEANIMLDQLLRPLVEHPKRVWIVTTLTLLVGLVFTWPAVDSYLAASQQRASLLDDLQEGEAIAGRLNLYRQQMAKKSAELAALEQKVLSDDELEAFRSQLVEAVKGAGCKLRRVRISDPTSRVWYDQDDPLDSRARSEKDKKSPFKLQQRQLGLLVTGPLDKVFDLLARLGEQDRLIHSGNFVLRKSTEDPAHIELDLDLVLFNLVPAGKPQ